ncbi:DUF2817 domain-containing protein, partial [candidate division KSB1 bacterium]|nr:DUF2817 domain-containing protein [candidate division KSB1 bacterium]
MIKKIFLISLFCSLSFAEELPLARQTPPVGTSYEEMMVYLNTLIATNDRLEIEIIGKSVSGRTIPAIYFPPKSDRDEDDSTIMLFAQQHGDEPSGKEALLMLITQFADQKFPFSLNNLNLILIPTVNPDGNELDQRRNANDVDLNRNHVILTEPEVQALHRVFDRYKPEVTLDIHEYGMKTWLDSGYIKDLGEQLDVVSNPAIPAEIKSFSLEKILHPVLKATRKRGARANRYLITRSDMDHFIRHSTTDINDGRNGFGIRHTLSFILEGLNGLTKSDRIWQRSKYQLTLIEEFLRICNKHSSRIVALVRDIRSRHEKNLTDSVTIHADYTPEVSQPIELTLKRTSDLKDTLITFSDYRPRPQIIAKVKRIPAYVVKQPDSMLVEMLNKQGIEYREMEVSVKCMIEEFQVKGQDTLRYESRDTIIPAGFFVAKERIFEKGDIIIPTASIRADQIVQILEPQSFYGISHYDEFKHLWHIS